MKIFQFLRDWSEVWAPLIPLIVMLVYRPKGSFVKWVKGYVILAFLLNFLANFIIEYHYLLPRAISKNGNNIFYNLHAFVMVFFLGWYLIHVVEYRYRVLLKALLLAYSLFVIINFVFWEPPNLISTRHFATGSIVLLVLCLSYFLQLLVYDDSKTNWLRHPSFIIGVAVCLYQAITFFIFLFLYPMFTNSTDRYSFALLMMRVYELAFIVFCVFIAIGLYKYRARSKEP